MDPVRSKLVASLSLAALAAGTLWIYLRQEERSLLHRAQEVPVVMASRYIPAYTRLDEARLEIRSMPDEYVPKAAARRAEDLKDLVTLAPFNAREPILLNKVARSTQSLAAAIPEGMRAMSLAVDAVSGVAGLVRPGDLVDVLL